MITGIVTDERQAIIHLSDRSLIAPAELKRQTGDWTLCDSGGKV